MENQNVKFNLFGMLYSIIYYLISITLVIGTFVIGYLTLKSGGNVLLKLLFLIPVFIIYKLTTNVFFKVAKSHQEFKKLLIEYDRDKYHQLWSKNVGTVMLTSLILLIGTVLISAFVQVTKVNFFVNLGFSLIPLIISVMYLRLVKNQFKILKNEK